MNKLELRKEMVSRRISLPVEEAQARSRMIQARAVGLPAFKRARLVMSYVAFRQEVETRNLIEAALSAGKRVAVPLVDRENRKLLAVEITGLGDLVPGSWGIMEPVAEPGRLVSPAEIDLVIVPGIAFDREGNRLGYGGGYFDRFLPLLSRKARTIGLAYGFQVVEKLAVDPGDVPVEYVTVENQVFSFTGNGEEPASYLGKL